MMGLKRVATRVGHVHGRPDMSSPTPDRPLASEGATVSVMWRNTHQRSDLPTVELAEFGKFGQQYAGGYGTNSRHTPQQIVLYSPHGTGLDEGAEVLVQVVELCPEPGDVLFDLPLDVHRGLRTAIALRRDHPDDLSTPGYHSPQLLLAPPAVRGQAVSRLQRTGPGSAHRWHPFWPVFPWLVRTPGPAVG